MCWKQTSAENPAGCLALIRCMEMQPSGSVNDFQQLLESLAAWLNRLYDDPRVSQLMNTRVGLYLRSRPVFALAALLFAALGAVPFGIFLTFAVATIIMSAVACVFFVVCVLFVGGVSLLGVLSGIGLFSVVVSFMVNVFYVAIVNLVKCYNPHLAVVREHDKVQGNESETSEQRETQ